MSNPINNLTVQSKKILLASVLMMATGIGIGFWLGYQSPSAGTAATDENRKPLFYRNPMNPAITSPVPAQDEMGMDYIPVYAEKKGKKILFYRNPMNPAITSPVPAQDEMGMDYIPVYEDGDAGAGPAGTVNIDATTIQNIGVRSTVAVKQSISHTVRAVGRVGFDEQRLVRLHPKTSGWIEKLHIDRTGESIKKNAILLSIYSPQLVSSQQEYLLALKNMQTLGKSPLKEIRQGAQQLLDSSLERLQLLDVPAHQIRELTKTGKIKKSLHIHSPASGVVMNVGARQGQYVTPQTELYLLADLKKVWVYVDIYEQELPWVRVGDRAEMELAGIPGRTFSGHVGFIFPYAESKTRTIKIRIEFSNPDFALKPDMFADVTVFSGKRKQAIVIPTRAIIRSGTREQVFVVREPGKFEPREVKLGITSEGLTQIVEGLNEGEKVVTSAQFLIDSESKLREATAKMLDGNKEKKPTKNGNDVTESSQTSPGGNNPANKKDITNISPSNEPVPTDKKQGTEMKHD